METRSKGIGKTVEMPVLLLRLGLLRSFCSLAMTLGFLLIISLILADVPTGTVLLLTITLYSLREKAICCATVSTCLRFAEPSRLEGVPTAIKMTLDFLTASSRSAVKVSRPADIFFLIRGARLGS
ncbi:hypothetical protein ES705_38869 [subsurface metagenome]